MKRHSGHFPSDEAAMKLIWLVLRNVTSGWTRPPISWHAAEAQFALQFEERFVIGGERLFQCSRAHTQKI
jgi:putative transposase